MPRFGEGSRAALIRQKSDTESDCDEISPKQLGIEVPQFERVIGAIYRII